MCTSYSFDWLGAVMVRSYLQDTVCRQEHTGCGGGCDTDQKGGDSVGGAAVFGLPVSRISTSCAIQLP